MSTLSKVYPSKEAIETDKLRCWLEVNLSNLKNNIEVIRSNISDKMDIICVVKANAYGFGSINIANYLSTIGIKYFAVTTLQEALDLRIIGKVPGEIIILTWTPVSEKETLIKYNLTQTLIDYEYAKKLSELPGVVKCHVKVDTGLNRFGHKAKEIDTIKKMYELKNLNILGIFSHLCREFEFDEDANKYSQMQIDNFNTVLDELEKSGINVGIKHLMNSLGLLRFHEERYDMVRPGLILYGLPPDIGVDEIDKLEEKFKPIGSLRCKVTTVKTIEKGEKVGYGSKYIAEEKQKIATISIWFVDGFPSATYKNKFSVYIKCNLCPIAGKVCMGCTMVRVPMESDIKEGDIVTIFGYDEKGKLINLVEFFTKTGLSVEETISRFGQRMTRVYHL